MEKIVKRIKNFEKTIGVKDENQGFYVLIRRKKKWLADEAGLYHGSVVMGAPSERDLALILPSHIIGSFKTMAQAQAHLEKELKEIRLADPQQFSGLGELQNLIRPEGGDVY